MQRAGGQRPPPISSSRWTLRRGSATIGGCIAMNVAACARCATASCELVVGLEAVRFEGTVLAGLNHMLKNNAGYDLKTALHRQRRHAGRRYAGGATPFPAPRTTSTALLGMDESAQVVELLHLLQRDLGGAPHFRGDVERLLPADHDVPAGAPAAEPGVRLLRAGGDPRRRRAERPAPLRARWITPHNGLFDDAVVAGKASASAPNSGGCARPEQIEHQHHLAFGCDVSLPIGEMEEYAADVPSGIGLHFGATRALGTATRATATRTSTWAPQLEPGTPGAGRHRSRPAAPGARHFRRARHWPRQEGLSGAGAARRRRSPPCGCPRTLDPHNILNPGKLFDLEETTSP